MTTPTILNIGCGTRTSARCTNVDWSPMLRLRESRWGRAVAPLILTGERMRHFDEMAGAVLVHDIRKGLPAGDSTVDVVYHSHVLEHLDRKSVPQFFAEVRRVLRPGGIHRVVVPDFEQSSRQYVRHIEISLENDVEAQRHDEYIAAVIEQMVRREAAGTSQQRPLRRRIENLLLGDARKRGETHQWMYDRVTLPIALSAAGFRDIQCVDHTTSAIPGWEGVGLDLADDRGEYKPGSLYVEAVR